MVQTDAVVLTSGNRRKAVLIHLDEKALLAQPGLRTGLALSLLEDHALRLGRAARLAGMASGDFIRYLSRLGITTVKGDARSLHDGLDDLDAWLARSA